MADALADLRKTAEDVGKAIEDMKRRGEDTRVLEDALKRIQSAMGGVAGAAAESANRIKKSYDDVGASLTPIRSFLSESSTGIERAFKQIGMAIYNTTDATRDYAESFAQAFSGTEIDRAVGAIDEATKISREFKNETIKIGSEFGLSFGDVQNKYRDYTAAVMLAQNFTYKNRAEIEQQTRALGKAGVALEEISKTFTVAGSKQNMLSTGFLLAADSGLAATEVFDMMAIATRKMGLSVEDSGRPLLALESLAKSTGLPITDLSKRVFGLAEDNARFGMTVEGLSPIVRRFSSVLGDGFKGFAIKDTERLIQGLASQVNQTNAAFMAMQSGMARPTSGVAGAMLDYEDAMAKPEEAMKMLASSLSNIGGGKILTMKDAHASESAAVQFKIQRDMLTQLTGINDPQQTKTLMSLLAEQQSGKQLSAQENKTLEDAMKSGANKQEEAATMAERMGKAQVGLLAQIALSLSVRAENRFDPQTQAALISGAQKFAQGKKNEAEDYLSDKLGGIINKGMSAADKFFQENAPGIKPAIGNASQQMGSFISENKANVLKTPDYLPPAFSNSASIFTPTTAPTTAAGGTTQVVVTFGATDALGQAFAKAASASIRQTNGGH